ncbi:MULTISPECIES: TnsD family Tn7-like transposition protein [Brevibacillus]|uniref:TnsD family Tn7-like transposition protein n=1 Tax=Brevibacillus TaxID=55080 RepID=UPI000D0EA1FE|nr:MULTISPECIES: TnsD family Tn7-like transposition protein [Brevibacillus]MED1948708.1 TnsD family Tn7-like transposition protein [Brevibacillus formosus]MED2000407.1 TnsD family Tn7-like transposition protein [Brevibacillus formosus]MED2085571.1 TnsD family Tn7-like transposition protein [Brevibacillus formosus]PSK16306.1 hypothetical protein C7R94_17450 [Brevibacillus sp. NRRL NRS-603]
MRKIVSFPTPYPDEDFKSLAYRHFLHSPYDSYLHSRQELFGRNHQGMVTYPKSLMRLCDHLGVSIDFIQDIIELHTFYPLYRPFLNEEQVSICLEAMIHESNNNPLVHKRFQKVVSIEGKYCPTCLQNDFQMYGVSYLHRTHQLKFLTFCHIHGDSLITQCSVCDIPLMNKTGTAMLITPFCENGHEIISTKGMVDSFVRSLLEDVIGLMKRKEVSLDLIYQKLLVEAGYRGYIHYKGDFIYKSNMLQDFVEFYGEETLRNLDLGQFTNGKFLVEMFQRENLHKHVLFNILLMRFFGGSIDGFFAQNNSYSVPLPFGVGPWRCLNFICPYYYKPIIKKCLRKAHEWVTGVFTCPHCEMIYTRRGLPKEENESQYSIETMGTLFISTAVKYYQEGYRIQKIAELMHSNKTTIGKYLRPFRKEISRRSKKIDIEAALKVIELGYTQAAATSFPKSDVYKQTVLEAIEKLGRDVTRPVIRKYNNHRYDWLMCNEREWMESVLPPRKRMEKELNLKTLDDDLSKLVEIAVYQCRENPPDRRISKATILRALPKTIMGRYYTFRRLLPKTTQLLQDGTESKDQYAVRNFPNVLQWFESSRYKTLSLQLIQTRFQMYKNLEQETFSHIQEKIDNYNTMRKD